MAKAVIGDIVRVYVKPSLEGELVIRKPHTRQTSARLEAVKAKVRATAGTDNAPARIAHAMCKRAGKTKIVRKYIPNEGYREVEVCPIKEFRKFLREAMKSTVSK